MGQVPQKPLTDEECRELVESVRANITELFGDVHEKIASAILRAMDGHGMTVAQLAIASGVDQEKLERFLNMPPKAAERS